MSPAIAPDQVYDVAPPPPLVQVAIGPGVVAQLSPPPPTSPTLSPAAREAFNPPPATAPLYSPPPMPAPGPGPGPAATAGTPTPTRTPTRLTIDGGAQAPAVGRYAIEQPAAVTPYPAAAAAAPAELGHPVFQGRWPLQDPTTGAPWTRLPAGAQLASGETLYWPSGNPRDAGYYMRDSHGRTIPIYRNDFEPAPEVGPGHWKIQMSTVGGPASVAPGASAATGGSFASAGPAAATLPAAAAVPVQATPPLAPGVETPASAPRRTFQTIGEVFASRTPGARTPATGYRTGRLATPPASWAGVLATVATPYRSPLGPRIFGTAAALLPAWPSIARARASLSPAR